MTKRELIEALAEYPDDTPVFVNGYESGLTVPKIEPVTAYYNGPTNWGGEFKALDLSYLSLEEATSEENEFRDAPIQPFKAVVLAR